MAKLNKNKPKKTKKGLTLHSSGQYRADIDGQTRYFGTEPKTADLKYNLYTTTKLYWSRTYRQFVKEIAGSIHAFGKTAEEARANYERFITDNWHSCPEPAPATVISSNNIAAGRFNVKTVEDTANAYVIWCYENCSDKHAKDARSVFKHLAKFTGQNILIVNLTASDFAAYRQHCKKTTNSRFNKHMQIIKAAFRRCRREQWLCVGKGWLEDLLDPLEQITIVSQEVSCPFGRPEKNLNLYGSVDGLEGILIVPGHPAIGI